MPGETPQATAVDAQLAEDAATQAAVAANAANTAAQSAVATAAGVAAAAQEQAASDTARFASEVNERLGKWREETETSLTNFRSETATAIQTQQAEIQTLRGMLEKTAEALAVLSTLKPQEPPAAETPPETPPKGEGDRREAKTPQPGKRIVRRL